MAYLVKMGCSTRMSTDPKSPLWSDFFNYRPGDIVESFPEWVPVKDWEESGHIENANKPKKIDLPKKEEPAPEDDAEEVEGGN